MFKKLLLPFQFAAVFIGTIVGAGLASGQEIKQFFTLYGYKSFMGIILCGIIYVFTGKIIISLSIKHNLKSYDELIQLISPNAFGNAISILMSTFLILSSGIILAGSGALINQFFGISKWFGIIIMCIISVYILLKNTNGLIEINSFIVPALVIIIISIFIMYIIFYDKCFDINYIKSIPSYKNGWLLSSFLYAGFNIFCCSGVLVPMSSEIKKEKTLISGLIIGTIGLTVLCFAINIMLLLNVPYIFKYEIPLLYIADRFGKLVQAFLLIIMWLEMFSTEVSDIYSIAKTLENKFKFNYRLAVIIIILCALPVSQIGFVKLISYAYPTFGFISMIFMIQCAFFYFKNN